MLGFFHLEPFDDPWGEFLAKPFVPVGSEEGLLFLAPNLQMRENRFGGCLNPHTPLQKNKKAINSQP